MTALKAIGPGGYTQVKPALNNSDIFTRLCALEVLASYVGPKRTLVIADLESTLEDPHPLVREETAFELGKMGPDAASAVPAIARARLDNNEDVSAAASEALKKIGTPEARIALEQPLHNRTSPKKSNKKK